MRRLPLQVYPMLGGIRHGQVGGDRVRRSGKSVGFFFFEFPDGTAVGHV